METPSNKIFIKMKKKAAYNRPAIVLIEEEVALIFDGIKVCNRQSCNNLNANCPPMVKETKIKYKRPIPAGTEGTFKRIKVNKEHKMNSPKTQAAILGKEIK